MFDELISRWWIVAARGVVAIVVGAAALLAPKETIAFLISLFGVFALADAVFTIGAGISLSWLALFLEGIVGGAIGLLTYFDPPVAKELFVPLVVMWAVVTGGLELLGAVGLRQVVKGPMATGEWLLAASGLLSVIFGALIATQTSASSVVFAWMIGGYALLSGVLLVALALNIRTWRPSAGQLVTAA